MQKLKKRFDLDGNGVPDLCSPVSPQGDVVCDLPGGGVTTIATSTYHAGMLKAVATPTPTHVQVTASLPHPTTFKADNGTKWKIEYVGNLKFTGGSQVMSTLSGDKCRSSKLGGKIIWNCGDMQCGDSATACGFSMVKPLIDIS